MEWQAASSSRAAAVQSLFDILLKGNAVFLGLDLLGLDQRYLLQIVERFEFAVFGAPGQHGGRLRTPQTQTAFQLDSSGFVHVDFGNVFGRVMRRQIVNN